MFFHIVKSDKIGTHILKEINCQNLPGEVTFMPLNRLTVKDIRYPQSRVCSIFIFKIYYFIILNIFNNNLGCHTNN